MCLGSGPLWRVAGQPRHLVVGNEILVGFEAGYFKHSDRRHSIDWDRPAEHALARSKDGGITWTIEKPDSLKPPDGAKVAGVMTVAGGKQSAECPGGIDFTNPDFAMTVRMEDVHVGVLVQREMESRRFPLSCSSLNLI